MLLPLKVRVVVIEVVSIEFQPAALKGAFDDHGTASVTLVRTVPDDFGISDELRDTLGGARQQRVAASGGGFPRGLDGTEFGG